MNVEVTLGIDVHCAGQRLRLHRSASVLPALPSRGHLICLADRDAHLQLAVESVNLFLTPAMTVVGLAERTVSTVELDALLRAGFEVLVDSDLEQVLGR